MRIALDSKDAYLSTSPVKSKRREGRKAHKKKKKIRRENQIYIKKKE